MPGLFGNSNRFTPGPFPLEAKQPPFVQSPDVYAYGTTLIQLVRRPYRVTAVTYGFILPAVVAATSTPFSAPPVKTYLSQVRPARSVIHRVAPPTVVAPFVAAHPRLSLASVPLQGRATHSRVRPPAVVGPGIVFSPVKLAGAPSSRLARQIHSRLSKPAVVGPGIVFRPVRLTSARTPRVSLRSISFLSGPTVVDPASTIVPSAGTTEVRLSASSRLARISHYKLYAPTVLNQPPAPLYPVRTSLAVHLRSQRQRRVSYSLGAPLTLGPAQGPPKIVTETITWLTVHAKQTRHVGRFYVAPPTIVGVFPTPDQLVVRVDLTQSPRLARGAHYVVRQPRVVTQPKPLVLTLVKAVANHQRVSRFPHVYKLLPPTAVGEATVVPPAPVPAPPGWSPFIDGPEQRHSYTAPDLWYGDKPPPPRRKR